MYVITRLLLVSLFFLILSWVVPPTLFAVENPTSVVNNKIGIHILFPEELKEAAQLVNSNGGDWGYVIIPIQSEDRNIQKWQEFMDSARLNHVIPILRLASEGDYFNTKVWRKPTVNDVLDFANFLNSLNWPIKNRYVVVFNEVNRGDEWGGSPNPAEYAEILSYATSIFKSKNQDFFVISAGMDNAAPTVQGVYMNEYEFLKQMNDSVPGIFNQIDGFASHSYPNPGFSQPPTLDTAKSTFSFIYEINLLKELGSRDLPVFITETGWAKDIVAEDKIAAYYTHVFTNQWKNENVVAVTPFILKSGAGPFTKFSFINVDGSPTLYYKALQALPKVSGKPVRKRNYLYVAGSSQVLGENTKLNKLPVRNFTQSESKSSAVFNPPEPIKVLLRLFFNF